MINVGIIGCGEWGPNHVRNFSQLPNSTVMMCADMDKKRLKAMKSLFYNIIPVSDYREILKNNQIDAVVVATPTVTHYKIVRDSLEADKHILCEKPLTATIREGEELVNLAKSKNKILMVGHVFVYNAGIQKLKEYIRNGDCGRIYYAHSTRTNLGPVREDVNAVWDLASHDVSIFNYLLEDMPTQVTAKGESFLQKGIEDVGFISLNYTKGILVNIHISWLDPQKVRQIVVVGDKKMVKWDDINYIAPLTIYDKGVIRRRYYESFGDFHIFAREGDITIPKINLEEPLRIQARHFLECIEKNSRPITGGIMALEVVKVLAAIQESMKKDGQPVKVG